MVLQHKKVAVIGAGPVGLTFARLLQQSGADISVYERDKDQHTRIKGGTLDIHHDYGQLALEKAGLLDEFYRYSRPTGERSVDQHGTLLLEDYPAEGHLYDRPEIDRNDLRKMLLEHLDPGTVCWDRRLISLEQQSNGTFFLHFENGDTAYADLVVGANGGMSNVRKLVTDAIPQYTGTIVIQGEVRQPDFQCPEFKLLCGSGNMAANAECIFFFSQTKSDGALTYYISFRKPEHWIGESGINFNDRQETILFLSSLFVNWNQVYHELFKATDEYTLLPMRRLHPEHWKPHHITSR
ncbi:NAD(P)/FAD-dependent oxidoreductase [Chryseobacterium sp. SORGH_AS_1048]|uniref:FAD-dependent oxidoreductase n=1 Tax=Chryseobacterium sp. SORGH_AS_1048 TaxID=3041783 RepID=UPI00278A42BF|nr:FAD-dependent monooxygenase [Chryseobacterium sp. SORGH_AS_1048]MDQ1099799.1 2-polyprenyl-6-methoxyphenol hydroxylase-like FAD-dependent oxidoreductase [Chryseobacterium sp. SORGH_AS_1048]